MTKSVEQPIAQDIVAHFLIRGRPVASAHKNRVGVNPATGRAMSYVTPEWEAWFASAIDQVEKTLKKGGHFVNRELVRVKTGKRKGLFGKNAHGQTTYVTNPLFQHELLRVVLWYYYPTQVCRRNALGHVLMTKERPGKPSRPMLQAYNPDTYNVAKGAVDALIEGGAIAEDDRNEIEVQVRRAILPVDAEPYIALEVSYFTDSADDWVIPSHFPGILVDPRVFMPRVFDDGHSWFVVKQQEASYQAYLRATGAEVPDIQVTKCRCKRCKIFVGEGCFETEIWWDVDEARWGKEVHLICRSCGEKVFAQRADIQAQVDEGTLSVCADNRILITEKPAVTDPTYGHYEQVRNLVSVKLLKQYRERYCLVTSDDIATTDWVTIERRRGVHQVSKFGETRDRSTQQSCRDREPVVVRHLPAFHVDRAGEERRRSAEALSIDEPERGLGRSARIGNQLARRYATPRGATEFSGSNG